MPFHTRLLGADRLALYSFIHSLNTSFGTSIFEPVAVALATPHFKVVRRQVALQRTIYSGAQEAITEMLNALSEARSTPNKVEELATLRQVAATGKVTTMKATRVDLYLEQDNGQHYLFDLKTAKPNQGDFKKFKRMLLEWAAVLFAHQPHIALITAIAIPYNPYAPQPYERWTARGMMDLTHELFVAEQFWDFLGGEGCFAALLDLFEQVGVELRPEFDAAFKRFAP